MYFARLNDHWHCHFPEADLKTSIPRTLNLESDKKPIEIAKRGQGLKDLADKQALEHGITRGRGAINLHFTSGQYEELRGYDRDRRNLGRTVED